MACSMEQNKVIKLTWNVSVAILISRVSISGQMFTVQTYALLHAFQ